MITLEQYERAEREIAIAESRHGFRIHALIYTFVMTGLTVLNVLLVLLTEAGFFWFPFPLIGWGIGLTMHYVYGVRRAEQDIRARQALVEARAEHEAELVGAGPA